MREKPIIFSGPMVRAILDGRKTMTRRVLKPQPTKTNICCIDQISGREDGVFHTWLRDDSGLGCNEDFNPEMWKCPYGQPGDRLWVRETFSLVHFDKDPETGFCDDCHGSHDIPPAKTDFWTEVYKADRYFEDYEADGKGFVWRPSIHMPRWASRITLEIVSVRVERLQEIGVDDAKKEGVDQFSVQFPVEFKTLWDSLNAKTYPWHSNPWVWVIEFRKL